MSTLGDILVNVVVATLATVAALLSYVLVTLVAGALIQARRESFNRRWEPVLFGWMDGVNPEPPAFPTRHRVWLMRLWLRTRHYVEGEAAQGLIKLAARLQLAGHAVIVLGSREAWKRMLAVLTLGELRAAEYWSRLAARVHDPLPPVSLAAIESLAKTDPVRAGDLVVPVLLARTHWDPVRVSRVMLTLGDAAIDSLQRALAQAPLGTAERTLRWLGQTECVEVLPILRKRLQGNVTPDEIAAVLDALGRMGGPEDRELAVSFIGHTDWRVRLQAVKALGHLGLAEDRGRVGELLTDPVWWVRYRAAGALYQMRGETVEKFRALAQNHPDRYARGALQRVLAEKEGA